MKPPSHGDTPERGPQVRGINRLVYTDPSHPWIPFQFHEYVRQGAGLCTIIATHESAILARSKLDDLEEVAICTDIPVPTKVADSRKLLLVASTQILCVVLRPIIADDQFNGIRCLSNNAVDGFT